MASKYEVGGHVLSDNMRNDKGKLIGFGKITRVWDDGCLTVVFPDGDMGIVDAKSFIRVYRPPAVADHALGERSE